MSNLRRISLLSLLLLVPAASNAGCVAICKPSGVCDPTDASTCSDDPFTNVAPGKPISSTFLVPLGEKNPKLAGALWGALVEEETGKPERIGPSHMVPGQHSGTMRFEGRPYQYRTDVQAQASGFRVAVAIWQDGSEVKELYEGSLSKDGRKGSLNRVGPDKARIAEFSW